MINSIKQNYSLAHLKMSKLYMAQKDSQKPSDVQTRVLTKKKIANYSYILSDQLGEGYSSKVYRGLNEVTNCPVAIKAIDMARINNEIHQILLQSEIECLKKFTRAQHVIQFMDVHATRNNTYIMTEFCEEGDLAKLVGTQGMPEAQAVSFMKQIVSGYLEIYKKGIIHRDLKPANIFIKDRMLKIADFGFAVRADDCKKNNKYNIGSPLYMPPEALLYNQYSYKSDIWALGIIFYELLTGAAPWNAKTEKQLANKIMSESIFRLMPDNLSPESVDFLTRTLECSINDRMTPEQLKNFSFSPKDERFAFTQSVNYKAPSILRSSNRVSSYQTETPSPKNPQNPVDSPPPLFLNPACEPLSDAVRKQLSKQLLGQIHLCRFLYKLIKRMELVRADTQKLTEELTGVIFHKLQVLCSCEASNPFAVEKFREYRNTTDFKKFLAVASQYEAKYKEELHIYTRADWKENYDNILEEIRMCIEGVYMTLQGIDPDDAPSCKDEIILVDYLITTYQLIQLVARGDIKEFSKKSKIETIVEGQPAAINYSHLKAVEEKLLLLGFI